MGHLSDDLGKFARYYEEFLRTGAGSGSSTYTRLDKALASGLLADLAVLDLSYTDAIEQQDFHLDLRPPAPDSIEVDPSQPDEGDEPEPADEAAVRENQTKDSSSRACRSILRKQRGDPYNRETLIGVGVLGHRPQKGHSRVGPLLYWEVDLKYDAARQRLSLFKRSPVPEINTLVLDAFLESGADIEHVVRDMQDALADKELTASRVDELFDILVGNAMDPAVLREGRVLDERFGDWLKTLPARRSSFLRSAVVANGSRSNAFLLQDLRDLMRLGDSVEGSALAQILSRDAPPSDREGSELPFTFSETVDGRGPLYFPLPSNPAQRKAGRAAERSPVLSIQGPPGTGKSQTIANLVSHLIATGNSVLVTSHQRKAVEVVTKHLSPFENMTLSLIQGDRESASRLRTQLTAILEGSNEHSISAAESRVGQGEVALSELDRALRRLASRYQELRALEHAVFSKVRHYGDLRGSDRIDHRDRIASEAYERIAAAIPNWCERYLEIAASYRELCELLTPEAPETARIRELAIANAVRDILDLARPLLDGGTDSRVLATRDWAVSSLGSTDAAERALVELGRWLDTEGRTAVEAFERLGVQPLFGEELDAWIGLGRRIGTDELGTIQQVAGSASKWFSQVGRDVGDFGGRIPTDTIPKYQDALDILKKRGRSFWRWFLDPAVRNARATVSERIELQRATLDSAIERMLCGIEWSRRVTALERLVQSIAEVVLVPGLSLPKAVERDPEKGARWLNVLSAQLLLLCEGPHRPLSVLAAHLSRPGAEPLRFERNAMSVLSRHIGRVKREFSRVRTVEAFRAKVRLAPEWDRQFAPVLESIECGEALPQDVHPFVAHLEALSEQFDDFVAVRDLELDDLAGLEWTLTALREQIDEEGRIPDWTSRMPDVLEAHRLGSILRGSLAADPDDITDIAAQLRAGESRRLNFISEIVQRKHVLHQAQELSDNRCREQLMKLKKLLGRKRLTTSLISLRSQIDYSALLRVVPGWVCSIDDAARLFPPKPGLFDVIIIDEASQCPQTVLLPLALRARQIIVVGDEKQLRPTFGMFVSQAQVDALKETHQIDKHRLGLFVEGRSSLLELASVRSSKPVFLDEHFRCEPPIIHWSNDRFYNNRLKILTHRRENGFTRPLALRRLTDADEDREAKVNRVEAEAVVREVRRLVENPPIPDATIGVISPFRPQADLIQGLLEREFRGDPEKLEKHEIVASTADGFQGDERDIILYSFRHGPSSTPNALGMLERQEERFNVAFTRARRLGISFISSPPERFPTGGVTRSWLEHTVRVESGAFGESGPAGQDRFDSGFERKVCERLRDRGFHVTTQVPCGNFRIDLVVRDQDGRTLAVECDGSWKEDEFGHLRPEDYQRQDLIERAGWTVHRIPGRRYLLDPAREVDLVAEAVSRQPTGALRAALEGDDQGATHEEPLDAAVSVHGADQASPKALREEIIRLGRWAILHTKVKGGMFDRVSEMLSRLKAEGILSSSDRNMLELLREIAKAEGFDPDDDMLLGGVVA